MARAPPASPRRRRSCARASTRSPAWVPSTAPLLLSPDFELVGFGARLRAPGLGRHRHGGTRRLRRRRKALRRFAPRRAPRRGGCVCSARCPGRSRSSPRPTDRSGRSRARASARSSAGRTAGRRWPLHSGPRTFLAGCPKTLGAANADAKDCLRPRLAVRTHRPLCTVHTRGPAEVDGPWRPSLPACRSRGCRTQTCWRRSARESSSWAESRF